MVVFSDVEELLKKDVGVCGFSGFIEF